MERRKRVRGQDKRKSSSWEAGGEEGALADGKRGGRQQRGRNTV